MISAVLIKVGKSANLLILPFFKALLLEKQSLRIISLGWPFGALLQVLPFLPLNFDTKVVAIPISFNFRSIKLFTVDYSLSYYFLILGKSRFLPFVHPLLNFPFMVIRMGFAKVILTGRQNPLILFYYLHV